MTLLYNKYKPINFIPVYSQKWSNFSNAEWNFAVVAKSLDNNGCKIS